MKARALPWTEPEACLRCVHSHRIAGTLVCRHPDVRGGNAHRSMRTAHQARMHGPCGLDGRLHEYRPADVPVPAHG